MAYARIKMEPDYLVRMKREILKKRLCFWTFDTLCKKYGLFVFAIDDVFNDVYYLTVEYTEKKTVYKFLTKLEKIGINVVSVDLGYIS